MIDNIEESVSKFYNTVGWETDGDITEDAKRWEDLREYAKEYISKCRLRVLRHIPENGANMLDMASGPIQYKEYLLYSKNFEKRYCVDLSSQALEMAKEKIEDHGVFLHGSFFEIPLKENFFDCTVSLHTIYHIDKDRQEEAVHKLIYVTKPEKPVIIVYINPNKIISLLRPLALFRILKRAQRFLNALKKENQEEGTKLYGYTYPIEWWGKFNSIADVKILPWRSFSSNVQKRLIPNNKIGKKIFDILFKIEDRFPIFLAKHVKYTMVILTKRK